MVSSVTAGMAGAYLMLVQLGVFRDNIVAGRGFIALSIVIFGRWNPTAAAIAALVFGAADALQLSLQAVGIGIPSQALLSLPYVMTILAMSGDRQPVGERSLNHVARHVASSHVASSFASTRNLEVHVG